MKKCFICYRNLIAPWYNHWTGQAFSNSVRNPVQMKKICNAGKIYAGTHTMLTESQTATPPQRESGVHLTGILGLLWFYNRKADINIGNPQRWFIGCVLHYVLVSSLLKCLRLPIKSLRTLSRHTSQVNFMHSAWNFSLKRVKDLVLSRLLTFNNSGHIMWHCLHRIAKDSWKEG